MWEMFKNWYQRRFSDPQALGLIAILLLITICLYFFNQLLTPLLVALVLAYLLESPIAFLCRKFNLSRLSAIAITLSFFSAIIIFLTLVIIPGLWKQSMALIRDLPSMMNHLHLWLLDLPDHYPGLINHQMLEALFEAIRVKSLTLGESILRNSLSSLANIITLGIYTFLVPLMVIFLIKDKELLINGVKRFLPRNRALAYQVWVEMKVQIANYIRGKFIEIVVIALITYALLLFFGLRYPLLLSVAVGLSVLVPYVGAVLVTIPIAFVGFIQFGLTPTFGYLMLGYLLIQIFDGNILVPILFSEAVNLHPLIIIIAVLIFGGIWGFWGVFFAIPLATLIKAIINAWPTSEEIEAQK